MVRDLLDRLEWVMERVGLTTGAASAAVTEPLQRVDPTRYTAEQLIESDAMGA